MTVYSDDINIPLDLRPTIARMHFNMCDRLYHTWSPDKDTLAIIYRTTWQAMCQVSHKPVIQ